MPTQFSWLALVCGQFAVSDVNSKEVKPKPTEETDKPEAEVRATYCAHFLLSARYAQYSASRYLMTGMQIDDPTLRLTPHLPGQGAEDALDAKQTLNGDEAAAQKPFRTVAAAGGSFEKVRTAE